MWSGPIHDKEFTELLLRHIEEHSSHYGTAVRMKGMVTLAYEVVSRSDWFMRSFTYSHLGTRRTILLHTPKDSKLLS